MYTPSVASSDCRRGSGLASRESGAGELSSLVTLDSVARREVPPACRARSMTPGDIRSARVGPDPPAGPKAVAGAARRYGCGLARFGLESVFSF